MSDWVSHVVMSHGADHARGGLWSLTVARTLDYDRWITFELDANLSRLGIKVYRSSADGEIVHVTVTSDRSFELAGEFFGLNLDVFGSPTLWPAMHRPNADGVEPEGESGWSWLHADASAGFPFIDGRRGESSLFNEPEGFSSNDA